MNHKQKALFLGGIGGLAVVVCLFGSKHFTSEHRGMRDIPPTPAITNLPKLTSGVTTNSLAEAPRPKIRYRAHELTDKEKAGFAADFERKYKPAVTEWCKAFQGRVPFGAEAVTVDKLVERIGRDSSYNEYVFVVDGITLGVQDKNGVARVDYLNAPKQTSKLSEVSGVSQPPSVELPVTRPQVVQMLEAESGKSFSSHEIRMIPSGLSGGLDGGVFVEVGGNPNDGASWKYDMVFGPDGKLAFYLRGVEKQTGLAVTANKNGQNNQP